MALSLYICIYIHVDNLSTYIYMCISLIAHIYIYICMYSVCYVYIYIYLFTHDYIYIHIYSLHIYIEIWIYLCWIWLFQAICQAQGPQG